MNPVKKNQPDPSVGNPCCPFASVLQAREGCDTCLPASRPERGESPGVNSCGSDTTSALATRADLLASDDQVVTGLSGRYARALYELADEAKALDAVASDLRAITQALRTSDDLRRLVESPLLSRDEQGRAMAAVLEAMGIGDLARNTVGVLARQRRLFALGDVARDFLRLLAVHRGETTAEVTSARPLSDAELAKLRATLKDVVRRDVAIETSVDPRLIGGLVVRIGSRMLDSAIRTKLQRLELAMKGTG